MLHTLTDAELLIAAQHHADRFNAAARCACRGGDNRGALLEAGLHRGLFERIAERIKHHRPAAVAQLIAIEAQLVLLAD
jgi:hypothetical protein